MKPPIPATTPPTLSFPLPTFAKLSPHPFLLAHLAPKGDLPPLRANARKPHDFRTPHINTSSLSHAQGSAVVRLGDTTVVCGIRAEILLASDVPDYRVSRTEIFNPNNDPTGYRDGGRDGDGDGYSESSTKTLSLLVPNIDLQTGCSPTYLPTQPISTLGQSLTTRLYSLLHNSHLIPDADLQIWHHLLGDEDAMSEDEENATAKSEIKAFWTLYIDVLFISLDGNPFDATWMAVLAALRDVRLPYAYWDAEREGVLCVDEIARSRRLSLRALPVACTFLVFREREGEGEGEGRVKVKYWVLADPDTFEEGLCDESVTVTVDCSGGRSRVLGISKGGGVMLGKAEMRGVVEMAEKRWEECHAVLESARKT